jgi:uncharacterized protein (DUF433 family)
VLEAHLRRVERDASSIPVRLYPFLTSGPVDGRRTVVIDPGVAFGQPTVAGSGVRTATIARRMDAGETVEDLAADYGLPAQVIEEAVVFENAA